MVEIYLENLIKLYLCREGNFNNILKTNFGNKVQEAFEESSFNELEDFLYAVVGYNPSGKFTPSEIVKIRKEFSRKSSIKKYVMGLCERFNCHNRSALIDFLGANGMLGLQKRPISTLGNYRDLGVPSSFLNKDNCILSMLVTNYLDNANFDGIKIYTVKLKFSTKAFGKNCKLSFDRYLKVKFDENLNGPFIKDGVLYCRPTGYSEEKTAEYLVKLCLAGMPIIPLYLRDNFMQLLPSLVSFGTLGDSILDALDISYLTGYTVNQLLNTFGYKLPDPEEMYSTTSGFFFIGKNIMFTKEGIDGYVDFTQEGFVNLINSGDIVEFDAENIITYSSLSKIENSNIFK